MDPVQQIKERLADHPELQFSATPSSVSVLAPSPDGFSVSLYLTPEEYIVHFDGWHEHFDSADKALDCFAFAYSGECRLAVTYRGRIPVKWILERLREGEWRADSEVGYLLVPFWLRKHVVYLQNPNLLKPA